MFMHKKDASAVRYQSQTSTIPYHTRSLLTVKDSTSAIMICCKVASSACRFFFPEREGRIEIAKAFNRA